ncbi:Hypothetical predicted protein [Xyrichtys novacula]|uniref:Uncharacterized protein n=1 Tax=Xyrichtys novacula TaxID=13765 RepID=A0AAV1GUV0_XYRNO|nr:Hypothetical predicted protein [Xyrichtys novacula]
MKNLGASGFEVLQEVLSSGQMIDSPSVTSLLDKKSRRGKRRHQSIQPLRCGAQRRGDALPNLNQQGPQERHLSAPFSLSLSLSSRRILLDFSQSKLFLGLKMFNEDALYLDRSCLREAASS